MVRRAEDLFSDADRATIAAAIAEAERETAGEIVPVVATASGRYDRAEDLFGLVVALAALAGVWLAFQGVEPATGAWAVGHDVRIGLPLLLVTVVVAFALGTALAARFPVLALPFVRPREMVEEVERAAFAAFHHFRVRRTAAGTGILIYVSLYERRVFVLGDDVVSARLTFGDWDDVRDAVLRGLRAGRPTDGLCGGIRAAGRRLAEHFPPSQGDTNEIGNDLRLV